MKYTIHGFNQKVSINLGLDADDLLILRYFVDFKDSGSMVHKCIDGEEYYWIKYEGIIRELPLLKLKKDSIYRRLKKMCKAGILRHRTFKEAGTYSFYNVGPKYLSLLSDINPEGTDINPEGVRIKIREGTDINPEQTINLLKDSSIKENDSSSKELPNKDVYKCYEQCGFGLLNATLIQILDADVELYGIEWVIDAMKEAVRQGKYKLSYAEGILRNWKTNGRNKEDKDGIAGQDAKSNQNGDYDFSKYS